MSPPVFIGTPLFTGGFAEGMPGGYVPPPPPPEPFNYAADEHYYEFYPPTYPLKGLSYEQLLKDEDSRRDSKKRAIIDHCEWEKKLPGADIEAIDAKMNADIKKLNESYSDYLVVLKEEYDKQNKADEEPKATPEEEKPKTTSEDETKRRYNAMLQAFKTFIVPIKQALDDEVKRYLAQSIKEKVKDLAHHKSEVNKLIDEAQSKTDSLKSAYPEFSSKLFDDLINDLAAKYPDIAEMIKNTIKDDDLEKALNTYKSIYEKHKEDLKAKQEEIKKIDEQILAAGTDTGKIKKLNETRQKLRNELLQITRKYGTKVYNIQKSYPVLAGLKLEELEELVSGKVEEEPKEEAEEGDMKKPPPEIVNEFNELNAKEKQEMDDVGKWVEEEFEKLKNWKITVGEATWEKNKKAFEEEENKKTQAIFDERDKRIKAIEEKYETPITEIIAEYPSLERPSGVWSKMVNGIKAIGGVIGRKLHSFFGFDSKNTTKIPISKPLFSSEAKAAKGAPTPLKPPEIIGGEAKLIKGPQLLSVQSKKAAQKDGLNGLQEEIQTVMGYLTSMGSNPYKDGFIQFYNNQLAIINDLLGASNYGEENYKELKGVENLFQQHVDSIESLLFDENIDEAVKNRQQIVSRITALEDMIQSLESQSLKQIFKALFEQKKPRWEQQLDSLSMRVSITSTALQPAMQQYRIGNLGKAYQLAERVMSNPATEPIIKRQATKLCNKLQEEMNNYLAKNDKTGKYTVDLFMNRKIAQELEQIYEDTHTYVKEQLDIINLPSTTPDTAKKMIKAIRDYINDEIRKGYVQTSLATQGLVPTENTDEKGRKDEIEQAQTEFLAKMKKLHESTYIINNQLMSGDLTARRDAVIEHHIAEVEEILNSEEYKNLIRTNSNSSKYFSLTNKVSTLADTIMDETAKEISEIDVKLNYSKDKLRPDEIAKLTIRKQKLEEIKKEYSEKGDINYQRVKYGFEQQKPALIRAIRESKEMTEVMSIVKSIIPTYIDSDDPERPTRIQLNNSAADINDLINKLPKICNLIDNAKTTLQLRNLIEIDSKYTDEANKTLNMYLDSRKRMFEELLNDLVKNRFKMSSVDALTKTEQLISDYEGLNKLLDDCVVPEIYEYYHTQYFNLFEQAISRIKPDYERITADIKPFDDFNDRREFSYEGRLKQIKREITGIRSQYETRLQQINTTYSKSMSDKTGMKNKQIESLSTIIAGLDFEDLFNYCIQLNIDRGANYQKLTKNMKSETIEKYHKNIQSLDKISKEDIRDPTKISKNPYLDLYRKIYLNFKRDEAIPEYILNIQKLNEKYPDMKLPNSGFEIKSPKAEIDNTMKHVNEIKAIINKNQETLFNQYRNLITNIIAFIKEQSLTFYYIVLEGPETLNSSLKSSFINDGRELEKEISALCPTSYSPITKIIVQYNLDKTLNPEIAYKETFNNALLGIFQYGIARAFRYIAIGEGNTH